MGIYDGKPSKTLADVYKSMSSYDSPITTMVTEISDNVAKKFVEQTENMIYQKVINIGVHVDKDELIKALQYDRDQYEKGYRDGKKEYEALKLDYQAMLSSLEEMKDLIEDIPVYLACHGEHYADEYISKTKLMVIIDKYIGKGRYEE